MSTYLNLFYQFYQVDQFQKKIDLSQPEPYLLNDLEEAEKIKEWIAPETCIWKQATDFNMKLYNDPYKTFTDSVEAILSSYNLKNHDNFDKFIQELSPENGNHTFPSDWGVRIAQYEEMLNEPSDLPEEAIQAIRREFEQFKTFYHTKPETHHYKRFWSTAGTYIFSNDDQWIIRDERNSVGSSGGEPIVQNIRGATSSGVIRVAMNRRLKQITEKYALDVIIPDEYWVAVPDDFYCHGFVIASRKLSILSSKDTIAALNAFDRDRQEEVAETICKLIYHSGLMDNHFENICLTEDLNVAVVNTEATALMCAADENYSPISLTTARVAGLKEFIDRANTSNLNPIYTQVAKKYLFRARVMHILKWTSWIASLCPILPLAVLITSVAYGVLNQRLPCFQPQQSLA